jgi:hypothetical protein
LKYKDLGLGAGLALGGSLVLGGFVLMSHASTDGGGGIMIVLGFLLVVPGAFIVVSAIVVWLFSTLYGSLSKTTKRKVKWGIATLILGSMAWFSISAYLYSRPSAITARQQAWTEQATLDRLAGNRKIEATRGLLVGAWRNEGSPENIDVFDDQGVAYSITDGEVGRHGQWSLRLQPYTPSSDLELIRNTNVGNLVHKLLQVDDSQLVVELLSDDNIASIAPGTAIQTYGRLANTEALPKFDPETAPPKTQPRSTVSNPFDAIALIPITAEAEFAENKTIDGVPHQVFENPIAVTTGGGIVRSGPGLTHSKVTSMYKGDQVALLAVTEVNTNGYLWFQIRYRDGQEGYASGALLCARESWIQGLHKQCPTYFR